MREVIKTGKTVEEATAAALAELGLTEDEALVEVLELPQKKLFKTIPAKVKVTADEIELDEPVPAPVVKKPEPKAAVKEEVKKPAAAPEKPTRDDHEEEEVPFDIESDERVVEAVKYFKNICAKMGAEAIDVTAVKQGENTILKVNGDDAGNLIGHRGEVMESLGYLTSLVANRTGGYMKLSLDINNYRSKREGNLTTLAKRIASKVAKTGRSHTFEPMNPYERRIIHSAVSTVEGVKSESTGEGVNRRVVVSSTSAPQRSDRPFRQQGRGGERKPYNNNREGGFNQEKKSSVPAREFADKKRDENAAPIVPKRTETVNDGANLPLYGKIEL